MIVTGNVRGRVSAAIPLARGGVGDPELDRLVREALCRHPSDIAAAVRSFRDTVEADPELLTRLVGRARLDQMEQNYVLRVRNSIAGKALGEAARQKPGAAPAGRSGGAKPQPQQQPRRSPINDVSLKDRLEWDVRDSPLWTHHIGGLRLGACKRINLETAVKEGRKQSGFCAAILSRMSADEGATVEQSIKLADLKKIYDHFYVAGGR